MTKQIPQNNNKDNNDNQDQELMLEINKIAKIVEFLREFGPTIDTKKQSPEL